MQSMEEKQPKYNITSRWTEKVSAFFPKDLGISWSQDRAILITCVSVALFFWVAVKMSQPFSTIRTFAISYNLPENQVFKTTPTETIDVRLNGTGWDLMFNYLRNSTPLLYIDIEQSPMTEVATALLSQKLATSIKNNKIKADRITPDYIKLDYGQASEKRVPLVLNAAVNLKKGYTATTPIQILPDSVTIYGETSALEAITEWSTEVIEFDEVDVNIEQALALETPSNTALVLARKEVQLFMEVEQFTEKALYIPIRAQNQPDSIVLRPDKVRLSALVPLSDFQNLDKGDFDLFVDFKEVKTNDLNNALQIKVNRAPSFLKSYDFSPKTVVYSLIKQVQSDSLSVE